MIHFQSKTLEDFPSAWLDTKIVPMRKPAPLFLRFGHFQSETGERSMNWNTGKYERGISVYPATWVNNRVTPHPDWLAEIQHAPLSDRHRYALTGRVIAEGSDGEPVLAVSSIVVRGVAGPHATHGLPIADIQWC